MPVVGSSTPDLVQQGKLQHGGAVGVGQAHGAPVRALGVQGSVNAREPDDEVGPDQNVPLPADPDRAHAAPSPSEGP
jgi:hypothetical protein